MKSSFPKILAILYFKLEKGTLTVGCPTATAFLIDVNMSEIGSIFVEADLTLIENADSTLISAFYQRTYQRIISFYYHHDDFLTPGIKP